MYDSILEIDLHGKNIYQSRIAIDAALRRSSRGVYRIRIIHGYNSGTAIKDFILDEYASHPRISRIDSGLNRGVTDLVLRDF